MLTGKIEPAAEAVIKVGLPRCIRVIASMDGIIL